MRRRYFRLSVLLVAFFVVSLGVGPLLAGDNVQPVEIKYQGQKVKHRAVFELSSANFSGFVRMAYQRLSDITPFAPPAPPLIPPVDGVFTEPIVWLGKSGHKNDPNEVPSPAKIIDDCNPM